MQRNERYGDDEEVLRVALHGWQTRFWTALPGIIDRFDPDKMIVDVQPAINGRETDAQGNVKSLQMPLLKDCPVIWQGGGGVTLTFPIQPGDECIVHFSSRCIDAWWALGGVQDQAELRMHNLSDGFALCGLRSLPRAFSVDTSSAQLRTDDGDAFLSVNATSKDITIQTSANINAVAEGDVSVQAVNATVQASGVASITAPSIILKNAGAALKKLCTDVFITLFNGHTHTSNSSGSQTSVPTQQASVGAHATAIVQAE